MKLEPSKEVLAKVRHPMYRARVITPVRGVSKTHQAHKSTSDINNIVARYLQSGVLPPQREPQYADLTVFEPTLSENIDKSRTVLEAAGKAAEAQKKARVKAAKDRQIDIEEKLKRLDELEAKSKVNREE